MGPDCTGWRLCTLQVREGCYDICKHVLRCACQVNHHIYYHIRLVAQALARHYHRGDPVLLQTHAEHKTQWCLTMKAAMARSSSGNRSAFPRVSERQGVLLDPRATMIAPHHEGRHRPLILWRQVHLAVVPGGARAAVRAVAVAAPLALGVAVPDGRPHGPGHTAHPMMIAFGGRAKRGHSAASHTLTQVHWRC